MCHFSSYRGGGAPAIRDILYMCFYDMKARHKASLLTVTRKLENIFPSLPSSFGSTFISLCWDNLFVYLDFPGLICLNEINGHFGGQIYHKLEFIAGYPSKQSSPKASLHQQQ